eukprot:7437552-Heterocapsa_arctica.AAC.1
MAEQDGCGQDDNERGHGAGQSTQLNRRIPCHNGEYEQATGTKPGISGVRGNGRQHLRFGTGHVHTRTGDYLDKSEHERDNDK